MLIFDTELVPMLLHYGAIPRHLETGEQIEFTEYVNNYVSDERYGMKGTTLELLLFLKENLHMW